MDTENQNAAEAAAASAGAGADQGSEPSPRKGRSEKKVRATVARGRTIDIPEGEKIIVNHTPEGRPITRQATRSYGPGQEVELPAAEVISLRHRGYLVDPEQALPPIAEGPNFTESGRRLTA